MAAASYYNQSFTWIGEEEKLENQARNIDKKTLIFQARIRGFLTRHKLFHRHSNVTTENDRNFVRCNSITTESRVNNVGNKKLENENVQVITSDANSSWNTITSRKAEIKDLEASYQEPFSIATCDSEGNSKYSQISKLSNNLQFKSIGASTVSMRPRQQKSPRHPQKKPT